MVIKYQIVSPEIICIQTTLKRLSKLYVCVAIIIIEIKTLILRERGPWKTWKEGEGENYVTVF